MWKSLIYLLPISYALGQIKLEEDIILRGDLQDELCKLFEKYTASSGIKLVRNSEIDASINAIYEKGTNILMIFNDILQGLHLGVNLEISTEREACIMLEVITNLGGIQNGSINLES